MKKLLFTILFPLLSFASTPICLHLTVEPNDTSSKVTVSITNNLDEDIKVLKWNTVFENTLNSNIFSVKAGEEESAYLGRLVKRAKAKASDYMLLKAGESKVRRVNLSDFYEMKEEGLYEVEFIGQLKYRLLNKVERYTSKIAEERVKIFFYES